MEDRYGIRICHLYPDLMNMYGDRGNVNAIIQRCRWRGIKAEVTDVPVGAEYREGEYDITFFGGGQDNDQDTMYSDLMNKKAVSLQRAVENGAVMLCICGGYQLMGSYYKMADGKKIDGIGAVDVRTENGSGRLIGNIVFDCGLISESGTGFEAESTGFDVTERYIAGFENHSGRTFLGPGVKPLGTVLSGSGNNGADKTEGAVYKNVFCSYAHGSLLPKNNRLTDLIITRALTVSYGSKAAFEMVAGRPLCSRTEDRARLSMLKRANLYPAEKKA